VRHGPVHTKLRFTPMVSVKTSTTFARSSKVYLNCARSNETVDPFLPNFLHGTLLRFERRIAGARMAGHLCLRGAASAALGGAGGFGSDDRLLQVAVVPRTSAALIGGAVCFLLRVISVWLHWNLPRVMNG
jgi:hypothetical protein